MKVTISINGRFHAFDLAAQLQKRDCLKRIITTYPKFKVEKWGIPSRKIASLFLVEAWKRMVGKASWLKKSDRIKAFPIEWFDRWASHLIPDDTDIFVTWSAYPKSISASKKKGIITVAERGSSHILCQKSILEEEYKKVEKKEKPIPQVIVRKNLESYELADYISIPSSFVKRTFLEQGIPEEKLIQIPYGVNLEEFKQIPKKDNAFRVVYAGSMRIRKGVHYLLEAFSELDLPNSELLLVGGMTEEMKPFFKRYEGSYKWIGHQPQNELYKYYSQGTVFVMPSIEEGLAMVQPQAMACGLPLICTTHTGGEDLIEEGKEGFVIPIRDVEALKEKILFFFENPEKCKQMGQAVKKKVQKGFTWDDYGEKMVREYKRILRSK